VLQTKVQAAARELPKEAQGRQEALTLKAIEDQRDVRELFVLFVETMTDVRTWGGALSDAAADGLKLLKAAGVGKELDEAVRRLSATEYAAAVVHQEAVLRGLRELLKLLQRVQGVMSSENQSALNLLHEIAQRQQAIRDETRKLDPAEKPPERLVEEQAKVQQSLARLEDAVRQLPNAGQHLEQAKAAAVEATAKLFENRQDDALAEQAKVLGNLAALEEALKAATPMSDADRSAADLAKLVRELEQAKQELAQAQQRHSESVRQAETNAQAAGAAEAQAAAALEAARKDRQLPDSVENRLEEAQTAAALAAKELAQAAAEPAKEDLRDALGDAGEALDRAAATLEAALEEAKRKHAAVEIGELARAAEVLERAAAEERDIGRAAQNAGDQTDPQRAEDMARSAAERQAIVEAVAAKVAEGLQPTSPDSARKVADGQAAAKQSSQSLQEAAESAKSSSEQSKQKARLAASQAENAAEQFAAAAKSLRDQMARRADQFAQANSEQTERLKETRAAVEKALDDRPTPSLTEQWERLAQAQSKAAEAAKQQQIAAGRPEAAQAMDLADQIAAAMKAQRAAEELTDTAAKSESVSSLEAAVEQQNAAEQAQRALEAAAERPQSLMVKSEGKADPLAAALHEAQQAAREGAKRLVDGQQTAATMAQDKVRKGLQTALELALAEAKATLAKAPSTTPDAAAQEKANQAIVEAKELAASNAPKAAERLAAASAAGKQAAKMLNDGQAEQAAPSQNQAAQALSEALREIDQAMEELAGAQARELEERARLAGQLAADAAPLDVGAVEALAAARDAARQGVRPQASPRMRSQARARIERNLGLAAANLATKEQTVRRDQAVAEAMADLAEEQQTAADMIAEQRDRPDSVEALAEATTRFAEAQQALGQGAVELSRQTEVANLPLREALELASEFPSLNGDDLHQMPRDAAHGAMPDDEAPLADHPSDDTPREHPDGADQSDLPRVDLGTSFIPKSPDVTARLMVGPQGRAALKAAQRDLDAAARRTGKFDPKKSALANKLAKKETTGTPMDPDDAPPHNASSQTTSDFSSSKRTSQTANADVKDGPAHKMDEGTKVTDSRGETAREGDEAPVLRKFEESPWFARLPPELRKSLRGNARQRAPRAYEEKLRKYFESVD
jgi:hypothetical protein